MQKFLIFTVVIFLILQTENSFAEGFTEKSECPILYEMTEWEHYNIVGGGESWGRWQLWMQGSWETSTGVTIDLGPKSKSYFIQKNQSSPAILTYIGPWRKITLTYPAHFWQKKKQTEVEIRLIATQDGKHLRSHFEIKDEQNSKIPEQKLVLLEPVNYLIDLCKIRWADKYGYNAVADCKLNPLRFFTGEVLKCSGKIIDSETKEIIAEDVIGVGRDETAAKQNPSSND